MVFSEGVEAIHTYCVTFWYVTYMIKCVIPTTEHVYMQSRQVHVRQHNEVLLIRLPSLNPDSAMYPLGKHGQLLHL